MLISNRPSSERPKVLIVDDDLSVLGVMSTALKTRYTTYVATDATSALDTWHTIGQSVNLAVIDIRLPGMSGADLARELKCLQHDLRVLYVSGGTDGSSVLQPGRRERFLSKPFSPSQLKLGVGSLIGHERPPCSQCGAQTFATTHVEDDGESVSATSTCASCGSTTTSTVNRVSTGVNRCPIDDAPMIVSGYGFVGPQGSIWNTTCPVCGTSLQTRTSGLSSIPW